MEESLEELYDNAPCGYFTYSEKGKILRVNKTLCRWLEYSVEEMKETVTVKDLFSIGSRIYMETHYSPLLFMQGFVKEVNLEMKTKLGRFIPVLVNSEIIGDVKQNHFAVRSVVLDITQRKKYEKELLLEKKKSDELVNKLTNINDELEKFTYVVSHDLKSPLATISLATKLLKENPEIKANKETSELIHFIETSSDKLIHLIDSILKYYKQEWESGGEVQSVEIYSFIESIVRLLNFQDTCDILIEGAKGSVLLNQPALEQILINLITNAMKYNDKDRAIIQIRFWVEGKDLHIWIQDNGPGIAVKDHEKAFGLFAHLGHKDRLGNLGTGIGLATVKAKLEKLNGSIHLESDTNKGCLFKVRIPIGENLHQESEN